MSVIRTRAQVRALVQRRTRIVDLVNAHPVADVNIDLDDGYRDLRQLVTDSKWATFLKTTGALALPVVPAVVGPPAENYAAIPVPTDCNTVKRLEINRGTTWVPIQEVGGGNIRDFNGFGLSRQSSALAWTLLDQGVQATTALNTGSAAAGVIALFPVPTTSGFYQLWYLPEFSNLTADSGAGGFYTYATDDQLQFHVMATCTKILISDNDSQGMLAGITSELARYEERVRSSGPTKAGPRTWRRARNY